MAGKLAGPPSWNTGIIYHESMAEHKCLWDEKHKETPERFTRIIQRCREYGLIDRCQYIQPRNVTDEELLKLYDPEMISILQATENSTDEEALEELSSHYDMLFIHPSTFRLSLLAAGSAIELVDAILNDKVKNGKAIIRPPGHHAMKSEYCGYCFYNNVALAARHALDNKGLKKILIVDWDIHHGQATQQMFYDDPRVLYFSIHGYQNGAFWPHLRETDYHNIGRGPGRGFNVNVPLNQLGMSNSEYLAVFHQVLLPIAYECQPELIIVSAGYDAALGCPAGRMRVTPACYAHFTSALMGLAGGRVAVVLEGGYCPKSLAEGAALTLRTLLGDPCPRIASLEAPMLSLQETVLSVIYVLREYWKCFQYQQTFSVEQVKDHSSVGRDQFWPRIEFHGMDEKPERYQTRNVFPPQDPNVAHQLDLELDGLIASTSLAVPKFRTACALDASEGLDWIGRCYNLQSVENQIAVVDAILRGEVRNGILILSDEDPSARINRIHRVTRRAVDSSGRIMLVDWFHRDGSAIRRLYEEDAAVLCVSVHHHSQDVDPQSVGIGGGKGYSMNVPLSEGIGGHFEWLSAFHRLILPIAYQFNPDLVVVAVGFPSSEVSGIQPECLQQTVHSLTALAGGKLALVVDKSDLHSAGICLKPLLGDSSHLPSVPERVAPESFESLRKLYRALRPFWEVLQFDVQVPNENVLIPPWVKDPNIHKNNPELLSLKS